MHLIYLINHFPYDWMLFRCPCGISTRILCSLSTWATCPTPWASCKASEIGKCFVWRGRNKKKLNHWKGSLTLQGTNISHLGKRKIIFKYAFSGGYVNSLEGNHPKKVTSRIARCFLCFFRWDPNWTLLLYILNQFNKLWKWLIAFHGYLGSMLVWFFGGVSPNPKKI